MEFHYSEPKSNYSGSLGRCNVQSQSTPPLIMGQACFKGITAIVFQTAKVKIYIVHFLPAATLTYYHGTQINFARIHLVARNTRSQISRESFFCTACSSSVYLKTTYSFVLQAKIRNRRKSGSKLLSSSKVGSYTHNYLILHSIRRSF